MGACRWPRPSGILHSNVYSSELGPPLQTEMSPRVPLSLHLENQTVRSLCNDICLVITLRY